MEQELPSLDTVELPNSAPSATPLFFPVSITKLVVMMVCTMSLYSVYWFYKNWDLVRDRERSDISPVARTLFSIFYCYPCFARIRDAAKERGISPALPAGPLAAVLILLAIAAQLPDPYWLIAYFSFAVFIPVQVVANKVNAIAAPGHDRNRRFSGANIAFATVFGILFLLALIGTFMSPEAEPDLSQKPRSDSRSSGSRHPRM